jgi:hypothetical protein
MVSKIADVVVANPELRRQALSVASIYIDKKMEETHLRKMPTVSLKKDK